MKKTINLCAFREAVQKTQREIADILNVRQSYVSEIENGKKCISKDKLGILVERFGQDVCDKFMVDKIDSRVMPIFNAPINGGTQKFVRTINEKGAVGSLDKTADIIRKFEDCQAELTKTKSELERAQKRIDNLMTIIENLSRE